MKSSLYISKMGVGGVQYLIERAYREGGDMQFVREFYKNAIEAGANHIEFQPEWQGVEKQGIYRLMVADNGKGMNAEEIEAFLNTFGGGGKPIGDAHENYGIGAKTSTLPWNQKGMVVLSWTKNDEKGVMLWLCQDPQSGEYGARNFKTAQGEYTSVIEPFNDTEFGIDWRNVKPEWIISHGTVIICLGKTGKEDTFMYKSTDESFILKGISSYLNKRVWEIPEKVDLYVQELRSQKKENLPKSIIEASIGVHPKDGGTDYRYNRRKVKGAKYHLLFKNYKNGKIKANGIVNLKDGTELMWYLWEGERPKVSMVAHEKGYIAALYDNELYDIKTHHSSFRSFGISTNKVRENLTIIAKPPVLNRNFGVYPDTARNALKIMGSKRAGESLPWAEWGEEFSNNLPIEIIEALRKSINSSSGTIEDARWRQKLAEKFGKRWNQNIFKFSEDGKENISKGQNLSLFDTNENEIIQGQGQNNLKNNDQNIPKAKNTNFGSLNSGEKKARQSNVPRGIPNYRWVKEEDLEAGTAAAWLKPSSQEPNGTVLLNSNFQVFEEVIKYWQDQYPDHFEDKVRSTIQEVYGQAMVARIAHSESLTRDETWGRKKVDEELRSPSSLTMAVLGLITEDHIIASKLGALLSKRQLV